MSLDKLLFFELSEKIISFFVINGEICSGKYSIFFDGAEEGGKSS